MSPEQNINAMESTLDNLFTLGISEGMGTRTWVKLFI